MTVLFLDGFDHNVSATQIGYKWTSYNGGGGSSDNGTLRRSGSRYLDMIFYSFWLQKNLTVDPGGPITIGTGIKYHEATFDWGGIRILSGDQSQCSIYGDQDGTLHFRRGSNIIDSSSVGIMNLGDWYYLEFNVFVDTSVGYYNIYLDGNYIFGDTNVNTQGLLTNHVTGIRIYGDCWYDDLYVTDGEILGDQRVDTLLPTASGTYYNQWTGVSSVNHHLNVDDPISDTGHDSDSTYNYSNVSNYRDSYRYQLTTLPEPSTIHAVQAPFIVRRDQPGDTWGLVFYRERTSETNYDAVSGQIFDDYKPSVLTLWNNPPFDTGTTWTNDSINISGEFGIKVV